MKTLLDNYKKLLRFNGFYQTLVFIIFIIFPAFLPKYDFLNIMVATCCCIIFPTILDKLCSENYTILSMAPFKTKDIIKLLYLHTYIIFGTSFIIILIINLVKPSETSIFYLVYISCFFIFSNIFYPNFTSTELKLRLNQDNRTTALILGNYFFTFITWIIMRSILRDVNAINVFYFEISLIMLNIIIAIFTLKKSYIYTLKKVMNYKA
ncbi:hypothetical protein [Clostridium grantii]|uniref:ABC-2 family transporter protein n=1 Tax=Clostridium grantii DSM 8605 TaxID=1121316 RepID=A0A1M5QFN7_9CLOT|nr:hypothetical protein [Clostridium grantii]SHH12877.1 hypothetical protein SAMN02745207_00064 [Clostridium grantii DSM 8605]